jgi:hypothetical protein
VAADAVQIYGSKGVVTLRLRFLLGDEVQEEAEAADVLDAHLKRTATVAKSRMEKRHRMSLHCELKRGIFGLLSKEAAARASALASQQRAAARLFPSPHGEGEAVAGPAVPPQQSGSANATAPAPLLGRGAAFWPP